MSPEQFAGKEVTTKSDIYALGLVLYEVFTGKRVFEAGSLEELKQMHESSAPANPSSWVKDLDPLVERVILRCLEKDPARRLASAKQVADALPGGDPLAAALALGETPSPEMVAAAGQKTGMKPMYALACLLTIIAFLIALPFLRRSLFERSPVNTSPEILARKAREINAKLGRAEPPLDTAYGILGNFFGTAEEDYFEKQVKSLSDWDRLAQEQRLPYAFWYRESRQFLLPNYPGRVGENDPPRTLAGMTYLKLNLFGHLRYFEAVPDAIDAPTAKVVEPDWKEAFIAAGLDFAQFKATEQVNHPSTAYDMRAAWIGPHPLQPAATLHVEAAAYRGRLVYFDCNEAELTEILREKQKAPLVLGMLNRQTIFTTTVFALVLAVLLSAAWLTRRNLRLHRGDREGAFRLAAVVILCSLVEKFLSASHTPTFFEFGLFMESLALSLLLGGISWAFYLSLEPYVRRRWPETLIAWQRILAGGWRDPLVGRDILLGLFVSALIGIPTAIVSGLQLKDNFSGNLYTPINNLISFRHTVSYLIEGFSSSIYISAGIFFAIFMACVLFRRDWIAAGILILMGVAPVIAYSSWPWIIPLLVGGGGSLAYFLVARRYGLLAMVILNFGDGMFRTPVNFSAWYAGHTLFIYVIVLALAIYAFYTSLGGQKVFAAKLLEE